jgi:hypothetical protein
MWLRLYSTVRYVATHDTHCDNTKQSKRQLRQDKEHLMIVAGMRRDGTEGNINIINDNNIIYACMHDHDY